MGMCSQDPRVLVTHALTCNMALEKMQVKEETESNMQGQRKAQMGWETTKETERYTKGLPEDGCLPPAALCKSCHPYALLLLQSQDIHIGLQPSDSRYAHMCGSMCKTTGRKTMVAQGCAPCCNSCPNYSLYILGKQHVVEDERMQFTQSVT